MLFISFSNNYTRVLFKQSASLQVGLHSIQSIKIRKQKQLSYKKLLYEHIITHLQYSSARLFPKICIYNRTYMHWKKIPNNHASTITLIRK